MTLIQDTERNIFGGLTPVECDSPPPDGRGPDGRRFVERWKADPSLKSFLFTLKNPHNFPARKFPLKAERKDRAICCSFAWAPQFRDGVDRRKFGPYFCGIRVYDNSNAHKSNVASMVRRSISLLTHDRHRPPLGEGKPSANLLPKHWVGNISGEIRLSVGCFAQFVSR
jgi:hypothetical protein